MEEKNTKKFVKSADKYEDLNSSGITLIITSIAGFIFLALKFLDIIPLYFNGITEYMFYIVMGGMFIAFFIYGIISLKNAKLIKSNISDEENKTSTILNYFNANFDSEKIDNSINASSLPEGDKYYKRYDFIEAKIHEQFDDVDDSYAEHLIEEIYQNIFE